MKHTILLVVVTLMLSGCLSEPTQTPTDTHETNQSVTQEVVATPTPLQVDEVNTTAQSQATPPPPSTTIEESTTIATVESTSNTASIVAPVTAEVNATSPIVTPESNRTLEVNATNESNATIMTTLSNGVNTLMEEHLSTPTRMIVNHMAKSMIVEPAHKLTEKAHELMATINPEAASTDPVVREGAQNTQWAWIIGIVVFLGVLGVGMIIQRQRAG